MQAKRIVEQLKKGKVAVIGDVVLDHYVIGSVSRISPEAPVPVLHVDQERRVLGGAANVAANIAALGGSARLVGVTGVDESGRQLTLMLDALPGVEANLCTSASHPTIVKTRYICNQQQIVRVDREILATLPDETIEALAAAAAQAARACGAVILSDYGKGVLDERVVKAVMDAAAESGALVVVDPKRRDLGAYRGASFITPNRKELSEAVGLPCKTDEEAASAAKVAIKQSGAAILLTRSERGMSLYRPNAKPVHLAAEAREVFDVSGAGDTVAALLGLGLAAKLPPEEAMRAANAAAGIVVGKLGTATCSPAELLRALTSKDGRPDPHAGLPDVEGAVALAEAVRVREQWAGAGLSVGFANGCFDLLHPGHVRLLRRAAAECDRLIVAINSDASVRNLKGPTRPVQNEAARAQVLASIKGVDLVIVFEEPTPLEVVQALQPDMIVKGADYTEDEVVGGDVVKARGGRVLLVDLAEGHSTTSILARAGDLS